MDTPATEAVGSAPEEIASDARLEAESVAVLTLQPSTDAASVQDINSPGHEHDLNEVFHSEKLYPEVSTSEDTPTPQNFLFQSIQSQQSEDTQSTGTEQEGQIENLAQLLADNLCREHTTTTNTSIFNFEEFESEEEYHLHQERLQQHLYQQHVLHQQEMQRQQDRLRRQHLSIITPDSARYSSLPSPGSKFFKQTPLRTPKSGDRSQSPTWYKAGENASYINRSGSPCSRKDRLYEAMPYQYFEKESLQSKYVPQFPHQPTLISKPLYQSTEADKEDIHQRLYETHFDRNAQREDARRETDQHIVQVGNTVHPRVLSDAERDQVTDRLLHHKAYLNRKFEAQRGDVSQALKEKQNGRFVDKKSHKLVAQTQRKALSEIFDVLLVTAQMQRERPSAPKNADFLDQNGDPVETAASPDSPSKKQDAPTDMLDTSLAQARFLQPKQLADAVEVILTALNPRCVSRKQFVEFTLLCMNKQYKIETPKPATKSSNDAAFTTASVGAFSPTSSSAGAAVTGDSAMDIPATAVSEPGITTSSNHDHNKPATDSGPEAAQQDQHQMFSFNSFRSTKSRASSPAHTPRANRASSLRTGLASSSAQSFSGARTPTRTGSRQSLLDRTESSANATSVSANIDGRVDERVDDRTDQSAPVEVPAASIPVVIPPIGYLLVAASTGGSGSASQREREEGTQAQREYRQHFTGQPHLMAQRTTEKLVQQRYAERAKGKQKVEDSLLAYVEQKRNNILQISMELDRATRRDCTFQPNINTPYMMRFKATAKEIPESRNVRTMIRRSASRSKSRSRTASEAQPGSEGQQNDAQTDTSLSVDGNQEEDRGRSRNTNISNNSGKRAVDTRPQFFGEDGYEAAPPVFLDQKAYLGFSSRSNSSNNLRRSGSTPRMRTPGEEIPMGSAALNYVPERNHVSQDTSLSSPSGARTSALSAQYRAQNGFLSDAAALRKHGRNTPATGRFSYGAAVQKANYEAHQSSTRLAHPHTQSAYNLNSQANVNVNASPRFFSYVREGTGSGAGSGSGGINAALSASSPRSLTTVNSFAHSQSSPALRTPRTAHPAENSLTEEALHRKMYKDLYYNF